MIRKTDLDEFTPDQILAAIADYEAKEVPELKKLWRYYEGDNPTIMDKQRVSPNNPDHRIPVPYGRKIVTTFTGYAFRPKYITYKSAIDVDESIDKNPIEGIQATQAYVESLQDTFDINNEPVKTARAGRNIAIFGRSYELLYIDGVNTMNPQMPIRAQVKFFTVDPREMILYYGFESEPKKKLAIRYYKITDSLYKVEVYYKNRVVIYDRERDSADQSKWTLKYIGEYDNYFNDIPVVDFMNGDELLGIIRPVAPLIDANDTLYSDAMNEFDRFAYAYLIMKRFGLTDPTKNKSPGSYSQTLAQVKQKRVMEHLPADAEVSFLTKDIPTGFIEFMADKIREQIHIQSHVPDFTSDKMSGASGIAIQRLLFDFENVVSSAEADFDIALYERIRLITIINQKLGLPVGDPSDVVISHKRNMPLNLLEFAQTAKTMKDAGFSSYLCADIMPDDIVPNVQAELLRQKKEADAMVNPLDMEMVNDAEGIDDTADDNGRPDSEGLESPLRGEEE